MQSNHLYINYIIILSEPCSYDVITPPYGFPKVTYLTNEHLLLKSFSLNANQRYGKGIGDQTFHMEDGTQHVDPLLPQFVHGLAGHHSMVSSLPEVGHLGFVQEVCEMLVDLAWQVLVQVLAGEPVPFVGHYKVQQLNRFDVSRFPLNPGHPHSQSTSFRPS